MGKIKFGICATPTQYPEAAKLGFDYAELPIAPIAKMEDADFAAFVKQQKELDLPTPVGNIFMPKEIPVVGDSIDEKLQTAYLKRAYARCELLGINTIIFGSGKARKIPDGFDRPKAFPQLVDFSKRAAKMAAEHEIKILVEPINKNDCNFINTVYEGAALVNMVQEENFQLMADLYHMSVNRENLTAVDALQKQIHHFHIADPATRSFPSIDETKYDYRPFLQRVTLNEHTSRMSIEGNSANFKEDAKKSLEFLRELEKQMPS